MKGQELFGKLKQAVVEGDSEQLVDLVKGAIDTADPLAMVEKGMMPGMTEIGNRFSEGEAFLPELLMAAEAWQEAMKLIKPKLLAGHGSEDPSVHTVGGLDAPNELLIEWEWGYIWGHIPHGYHVVAGVASVTGRGADPYRIDAVGRHGNTV